jgi:hypothetical protein
MDVGGRDRVGGAANVHLTYVGVHEMDVRGAAVPGEVANVICRATGL